MGRAVSYFPSVPGSGRSFRRFYAIGTWHGWLLGAALKRRPSICRAGTSLRTVALNACSRCAVGAKLRPGGESVMSIGPRATVINLQERLDELHRTEGRLRTQVQLRAGTGEPCALCRCTISPRDVEQSVLVQASETHACLRFHASCYATWDRYLTSIVRSR
jgi:hypothetical protein